MKCPKCGDRLPTKDYYRAESLQRQLDQARGIAREAVDEWAILAQRTNGSTPERVAEIRKGLEK